jgi:uncharacterized protein YdhG (YjbR/CyaY superfamily)
MLKGVLMIETFKEYLEAIPNPSQRERTEEVLEWIHKKYPELQMRIAWNQPMFTDHGTFIIGFSISSKHLACAPEMVGIKHFSEDIKKAGYEQTMMLMKFPWNKPVDYELLGRMIEFNIIEKADCQTFWRK